MLQRQTDGKQPACPGDLAVSDPDPVLAITAGVCRAPAYAGIPANFQGTWLAL